MADKMSFAKAVQTVRNGATMFRALADMDQALDVLASIDQMISEKRDELGSVHEGLAKAEAARGKAEQEQAQKEAQLREVVQKADALMAHIGKQTTAAEEAHARRISEMRDLAEEQAKALEAAHVEQRRGHIAVINDLTRKHDELQKVIAQHRETLTNLLA